MATLQSTAAAACQCSGIIKLEEIRLLNAERGLVLEEFLDKMSLGGMENTCFEAITMVASELSSISCANYKLDKLASKTEKRRQDLRRYGNHEIMPEANCYSCTDLSAKARLMQWSEKMTQLAIQGYYKSLLRSIKQACRSPITIVDITQNDIETCNSTTRTALQDGVTVLDATAGFTLDVYNKVIDQLEANNADTSDVLFIIPSGARRALENDTRGQVTCTTLTRILADSLGAYWKGSSSTFLTPKGQKSFFEVETNINKIPNDPSPIATGVIGYAISRKGLKMGYYEYALAMGGEMNVSMINSMSQTIFDGGSFQEGANGAYLPSPLNILFSPTAGDNSIGLDFRVEANYGIMRSQPGSIVQIAFNEDTLTNI